MPQPWRREHRQLFWDAIARGSSTEEAGAAFGLSSAQAFIWFRQGGGMRTVGSAPLSGRYLSFVEREELAVLKAQGLGIRE
ncbi:MAG TPA: helix-turn-helix domain-containing protein, partial [Acidimicrobiales bacterium]